MNSFPRLLCMAALATAAFAQTPDTSFVTSDPSLAGENRTANQPSDQHRSKPSAYGASSASANQPDLQLRTIPERVLLPTATVLRLKLTSAISTASARPGQQFTATLTRPVEVGGQIVIPAGATVNCKVNRAHGARRLAGKPLLSIKAIGVRSASGDELSFSASVVDTGNPRHLDVDEEGSVRGASPNPLNKVELGALAGAGAIAGAVIAGPEGLLLGSASGAVVAAGHIAIKHRELTLPAGTELIFELDAPATSARPQQGGMQ
jgi:hypothetical protein